MERAEWRGKRRPILRNATPLLPTTHSLPDPPPPDFNIHLATSQNNLSDHRPVYSRRDFTRMLALSGAAALLPTQAEPLEEFDLSFAPLPPTPPQPQEKFWQGVRAKFLIPRRVCFMNAANLCPTSLPVVEALEKNTRTYDAEPSPTVRTGLTQKKEEARRLLAEAMRVTPEEIVITRNTSEGNNLISSGLQLGAQDEVLVFSDNHPSNLNAWREKARRFGYTVTSVAQVSPHPGADFYVDAFSKAITARTKVVAITHVSSNSGDLLPVNEICRMARERGVMSHVDGAQSFGALDINLREMRPDFYTGSAHKWPCGPKETGLLYINSAVHDRIFPSVVSLYPGAVGISRTMEANGQRDDAALAALAESVKFQGSIGRAVIEKRVRELAQYLMTELKKMNGMTLWTDPDPRRSGAIVVFRPGTLDARRLGTALYENERIVVTTRPGMDRPGLRLSPHFYNTMEDMDRFLAAMRKYSASGV
jgi:isopenicillin-N epimerase